MFVFLACMLFANFIAVRMMLRYGVEAYLYDKLLVAYAIGGERGLKTELGQVPLTDKSRLEARLAKDFSEKLGTLRKPGEFLQEKVERSKSKLHLIRSLRSAAIALMIIIFGWQLIVNFIGSRKSRKSA